MRLFEWDSKAFDGNQQILSDFVKYLAVVWQSRKRYIQISEEISEEEQQEEKIQKQRFFDFTIDGKISARNYVGVVQFEDVRIEVYPKIFSREEGNEKKWQVNLLYWLSYCRKIKFPFSVAEVTKLDFEDFLELLIYVFANYTEEIISQQPYQTYHTVDEETVFLRGRMSLENYTNRILTTGKWQNFYCIHEPFVYDNLFNRIIKYVTRRLSAISQNSQNREKMSQILFNLHDVSDVSCTFEDCEKVKLNSVYQDHYDILQLCKMYLSNQIIDMNSEDSKNFCFLVPMEYVFEDFCFGFVSDNWPTLNVRSQSEDHLAINLGKEVFRIKNDLYIKNELIIDTKYKIRSNNNDLKAGVSQNDMYQIVSYALRRNCKRVLLLYPRASGGLNKPTSFRIRSEMFAGEINIDVRNTDITFENIAEADELIKTRVEELNPIFIRKNDNLGQSLH